MSGKFITVEGIDGCGKSTQVQLLASRLSDLGIPYLLTREPGGSAVGEQIREIVLHSRHEITATTELLLYAADRAQHVAQELRPALAAGKIIICDRYTDATVAYQGHGRELSLALINQLNQIATDGLEPHLTLYFDLDIDAAQQRMANSTREAMDRLEREAAAFHQRVRNGYLALIAEHPQRFRLIDASNSPDEIFLQVWAAVSPLLPIKAS